MLFRSIHGRVRVSGRLVLVDDVWTTGATLHACALTLYSAGATSVDAIAYARARPEGWDASGTKSATVRRRLDMADRSGTIRAPVITHERSAMRVDVKGLNVPVNDDLREQVDKRFGTISKQVSELATLDVILSEERNPAIKAAQCAEANLRLKGVTLHAKAQASEMRSAIGQVADELQRQVVKRRDRIRHPRRARRVQAFP